MPLVYNSRYPDLRLLGDSSKRMIWMLPNNSYTSSLAAKHKDAEIVWTKTKNTSEPFLHARYKLDSFAVNIAL